MTKTKRSLVDMTYVALGAVIISVCAFITVPFTIPFTMQTFAVFAVLLIFGGKRGILSVFVYIALGTVGVPVFSAFRSGIGILCGPTGGYITGFLAIAVIYFAAERIFKDKSGRSLVFVKIISLLIGMAVMYLLGTLQFVAVTESYSGASGFVSAMMLCVFPYIIPDMIKLALAFAISVRLSKIVNG